MDPITLLIVGFLLFVTKGLDALQALERKCGRKKGFIYTSAGVVKPNAQGLYIRTVVVGISNKADGSTQEVVKYGVLNDGTHVAAHEIGNYPQMHLPGLKSATRTAYPINHPDGEWRNE
jgi:hypothetical protein